MIETWGAGGGSILPPASLQNPCLTCGACCAAFRVAFYWAESDEAVVNCIPADMTCHIAPLLCAMKGTDQPHPWCVALQGSVGIQVWCSIYERRPSVCQEVQPSGTDGLTNPWCDRARALWGLPPLIVVDTGGQNQRFLIDTSSVEV